MRISNSSIFKQEEWDYDYENMTFFKPGDADEVRKWITRFMPLFSGRCFEVGCFPGRYLTIFGENGMELNGIDLTPRVNEELPAWLKSNDYLVGTFYRENFLDTHLKEKYNVVSSFGFIEHFNNWPEVILKHYEMVVKSGYLMISTPNFRGYFQKLLHSKLDNVNFHKHVIDSMNPELWSLLFKDKECEIIFSGYFGKFDFWHVWQSRKYWQRFILYRFIKIVPLLKKIVFFNSKALSPFCGIVVKKNE